MLFNIRNICFLILLNIFVVASTADELKRRASWQAKFKPAEGIGRILAEMVPNSPLEQAGLRVNDRGLSVNQMLITSESVWNDITDSLTADQKFQIDYRRGHELTSATVSFKPIKKEHYSNLDTIYETVVNDYGIRQRTITTKPKGLNSPSPAIFIIQGLGCSSIEYTPRRQSNFIRLIQNIIQDSNMVVMRI